MTKGTTAVGYIRVSTREQGDNGHGLAAQEAAIREVCARRGWQLAGVHQDVISSGRRHRPGLDAAVAQARELGAVLVASKASRIARSTLELMLLHERAGEEGWHLFTTDMPEVDTTTPQGELMLTVMAAFNRYERRMVAERTKEALAAARAKGVRLGRRPASAGPHPDAARTTPERQQAALERKARIDRALPRLRELRAGGASLRATAEALNAEGLETANGKHWHASSVQAAERGTWQPRTKRKIT